MERIDNLDRKILEIVMRNARIPSKDVATECGVSRAAIHQRIQKLMSMGVLKGSECLIDPASVGYETCAYMGFFLKDPSRFDEVVEKLKAIPEVVEIHFTTGQYDMFIKLYAHNNDHLLHIIHEQLQGLGLARTESLISFKEVLKRQIPVSEPQD